jgi:hypothetical protein
LHNFPDLAVLAKLALDTKHGGANYFKSREVTVIGDTASVSYDVPLVRPGEKIMISEVFKIKKTVSNRASHPMDVSAFRPIEVVEKLLKIKNFVDYFKVKIYVSSGNAKQEKREADIYCFHGSMPENISRTLEAITPVVQITKKTYCVWSPPLFKNLKIPIPIKFGRWMLLPPIGSLDVHSELIEIIIPHLEENLRGKLYLESNPLISKREWVSFAYPQTTMFKKYVQHFGKKRSV